MREPLNDAFEYSDRAAMLTDGSSAKDCHRLSWGHIPPSASVHSHRERLAHCSLLIADRRRQHEAEVGRVVNILQR